MNGKGSSVSGIARGLSAFWCFGFDKGLCFRMRSHVPVPPARSLATVSSFRHQGNFLHQDACRVWLVGTFRPKMSICVAPGQYVCAKPLVTRQLCMQHSSLTVGGLLAWLWAFRAPNSIESASEMPDQTYSVEGYV